MGVLALLAGWLVAGRMLRPIRTITRTARRISSTSLHERLALDGPEDELKELGDTLDDLFGRLDAAFEAQRRFVANASHELRTPLTRERALVQVALGDPSTPAVWRSTGQELLASNREQETSSKPSSPSPAARADSTTASEPTWPTSARPSCPAPCLDTERLGLQVETAINPAPLEGDPRLIERLVANLVDNAIAHNVAGGHIQISTDTRDRKAVLSVTNTGPIISPGEIDRLFQPFQRLDPRRTRHKNGHGLGLSIVRAIAAAHHATVTADAQPGGGLAVTVAFPQLRQPGYRHQQDVTNPAIRRRSDEADSDSGRLEGEEQTWCSRGAERLSPGKPKDDPRSRAWPKWVPHRGTRCLQPPPAKMRGEGRQYESVRGPRSFPLCRRFLASA